MTLAQTSRKFKRTVSVFFLFNIVAELVIPLKVYAHSNQVFSGGGSSPVAASANSMVDGYTGDFHYSIPLMTVPGPNGESVPITAGYQAGIGVNQKASWIGLGWDYGPGEISRNVVGTPDDYNGRVVNELHSDGAAILKQTTMFGAMYTKNIKTSTSSSVLYKGNDFFTVYRHLPEETKMAMLGPGQYAQGLYDTDKDKYRFSRYSIPFQAIAYDDYYVSGGLSGKLHPFTLGENQFHSERVYNDVSMAVNTKKVQFYFANSSAQTVAAGNWTNSSYVNQSTNRIHSGTFVKYYTNAQINVSDSLFNNTTQKGFLDYRTLSGTRRPSSDFDPDGIGGFEVTDVNGITYHYSLPVYVWDDCSYQVNSANLSFSSGSGIDYLGNSIDGHQNSDKYARSWKLTAVTGPDYQDANNNKMVDEGDTGYWVNYNYSLWSSDYYSASQRFGCKQDGVLTKSAPGYFSYFNGKTFQPNTYQRTMNLSKNHSQVYVLNYIQTASHTAFFVKSVRLDEQSYDNMVVSTDKPTPLLKLDRIILVENINKGNLINSTPMSSGDKDSRFSYASCSSALSDPNFVHITKYNSGTAAINSSTLKSVVFETDYTLAPKYAGNIVNTYSYTPVKHASSPNRFFYNRLISVSNSSTQSGKLTLNKIKFYEFENEKITPSVDFDYAVTDTTKNPVCHEDKTDLWGYYKNDYVNSHYTTDVSRNQVDAWSLREITTPLGGKIKIEYEPDMYHSEGFLEDPDFMPLPNINLGSPYHGSTNKAYGPISTNMPHYVFPMKSFDVNTNAYYMEDADSGPISYGYGRDQSIPYEEHSCLIVNYIDQCSRQLLYYNNGNSYIYTEPVQKLVHRGQSLYYNFPYGSGTYTYPGSFPYGTGPNYMTYVTGLNPIAQDFDLSTQCTAGYSNSLAPNAINFQTVFRNYLYGGGIRVKKIQTVEPYKDLTYTQLFTYGNGYCPVVPKPTALCYGTAPGAYDVCVNYKPLLNPQINSRVGYDYMQTTTINEKGETNGSVKQVFFNKLISNPLTIDRSFIMSAQYALPPGVPVKVAGSSSCNYYTPVGPGTFDNYIHPVSYYFNMVLNRGDQFLGKILQTDIMDASDRVVSTTSYKYGGASYIEEKNKPSSSLSTFDNYSFITSSTCHNTTPVESSLFAFTYVDGYAYSFTYRFYNSAQLIGTTTTRDGITVSNTTLGTDPYTNLQTGSISVDPTVGTLKTETGYAYNNSSYSNLGLKSVSENYKNQPALMLGSRALKGKYVIGQSRVTYSNQYPTREYDATSAKYKNSNLTKNWYRVDTTFSRLLDDNVLATVTPSTPDWRVTSVGTLYDRNSSRIEEAGLNDRKSASKWGYNNYYKLATISNANYNSFTFTGFEDQLSVNASPSTIHFGGEVTGGQSRTPFVVQTGGLPIIKPHTGSYMAAVGSRVTGPKFNAENFETGRTYVAKVWIYKNSPALAALTLSLTGITGTATPISVTNSITRANTANLTVGDWVLMSVDITVPANLNLGLTHNLSVSLTTPPDAGTAYFDDLAFHPKDAVLTGNVYNEKTGLLVAQLDNENFATLYNYDNAGRVLTTYKEYSGGTKKITETSYHFAKP